MAKKLALGQRYYNYGFTDSLLFTEAYMRPRYKGSKLIAKEINKYTDYDKDLTEVEWVGKNPAFGAVGSNEGFITTTKPIDGTFPFPFTLERDTPWDLSLFYSVHFKGNLLFPIPYQNIKTIKDIITQEGHLRGYPTDITELIFGLVANESQKAGGYRKDRSYG